MDSDREDPAFRAHSAVSRRSTGIGCIASEHAHSNVAGREGLTWYGLSSMAEVRIGGSRFMVSGPARPILGTQGDTMPTIYVDRACTDDDRRRSLYSGDLQVLSPSQGAAALCSLARELSEEAFAPHDPKNAQEHTSVEDYVGILKELKP